mmetsp:Transcript_127415/g.318094  ORF Transcript_127415/g.318094 Transcript_127415/m.318094 type:complete len:217 (+) Transcript_127415:945-1595(+)
MTEASWPCFNAHCAATWEASMACVPTAWPALPTTPSHSNKAFRWCFCGASAPRSAGVRALWYLRAVALALEVPKERLDGGNAASKSMGGTPERPAPSSHACTCDVSWQTSSLSSPNSVMESKDPCRCLADRTALRNEASDTLLLLRVKPLIPSSDALLLRRVCLLSWVPSCRAAKLERPVQEGSRASHAHACSALLSESSTLAGLPPPGVATPSAG